MSIIASLTTPSGLRRVLGADAAAGIGMGVLHLSAAGPLADGLGLAPGLLVASGWLLMPYVLLAGALALRRAPAGGALALLVAGNLLWVLASVAVLWVPSLVQGAWGQAYVALQAASVLVLAQLQWMGLRRSRRGAQGMAPATA